MKTCQICWDLTGVEGTREQYGLTKELPQQAAMKKRVKHYNFMVRMGHLREYVAEKMGITPHSLSPWQVRMRKLGFTVEDLPPSQFQTVAHTMRMLQRNDLPPRQRVTLERMVREAPAKPPPPPPPDSTEWARVFIDHQCPEHGSIRNVSIRDSGCERCDTIRSWARCIYMREWRKVRNGSQEDPVSPP